MSNIDVVMVLTYARESNAPAGTYNASIYFLFHLGRGRGSQLKGGIMRNKTRIGMNGDITCGVKVI